MNLPLNFHFVGIDYVGIVERAILRGAVHPPKPPELRRPGPARTPEQRRAAVARANRDRRKRLMNIGLNSRGKPRQRRSYPQLRGLSKRDHNEYVRQWRALSAGKAEAA